MSKPEIQKHKNKKRGLEVQNGQSKKDQCPNSNSGEYFHFYR